MINVFTRSQINWVNKLIKNKINKKREASQWGLGCSAVIRLILDKS
jgi:hypothetical protein